MELGKGRPCDIAEIITQIRITWVGTMICIVVTLCRAREREKEGEEREREKAHRVVCSVALFHCKPAVFRLLG